MNETNGIEDLFDPAKPERKWNWFLLPCQVLPDRRLTRKLQDDGTVEGAEISNNTVVDRTETLVRRDWASRF